MDSKAQQEVRRRVSKTQEKEKDAERRKQKSTFFVSAKLTKMNLLSRHPIIDSNDRDTHSH
jgi:hypothetical protein